MKVMEMTQRELTAAIATGLSSVVKERCDQIDSRVNALAESLSRRLDALERRMGPVGCPPSFQGTWWTWRPPATDPGDSDSDSKDALIRDLMTFTRSNPDTRIASEYLRWGNKVESFRDRAEKLGVKL